jgi:hypothetical protein
LLLGVIVWPGMQWLLKRSWRNESSHNAMKAKEAHRAPPSSLIE